MPTRLHVAPRVWNRRQILIASGAMLATWPGLSAPVSAMYRKQLAVDGYPFAIGVASGDPTSDGFVLWTRLAPQPLTAAVCRARVSRCGGKCVTTRR